MTRPETIDGHELATIDHLAIEFERQWSFEQPISGIFDFVAGQRLPSNLALGLTLELAIVDLERRWQNWGKRDFVDAQPAEVEQQLRQLPTHTDYLAAFQAFQQTLSLDMLTELRTCEWKARLAYGDSPTVPNDMLAYVSNYVDRFSPLIRVEDPTTASEYTVNLLGSMSIGRQAQGEPEPPQLHIEQARRKLICVPGRDALVSRNQLRASIMNRGHCLVENTSQNRWFSANGVAIPAASAAIVKLPTRIDLTSIVITILRPSMNTRSN